MKSLSRKLILIFICLLPLGLAAQEAPAKEKAPATSRVQKKAAKKKWKEQRKMEMDQKKAVKQHHKRIQTKETRKRMKQEKRRSDKLRANKREFFLVRWFRRH
ncbi:MAG: hypothetical protein JWO09_2085 [Bacteroidetes bacterium]|nr:hypothetical protein [Bacteroidota bacterium]